MSCLVTGLSAYDDVCDQLAEALDPVALQSTEEHVQSGIEQCVEFAFDSRHKLSVLQQVAAERVPPVSPGNDSVKSEPSGAQPHTSELATHMGELIQLSKFTHEQTQQLITAQHYVAQSLRATSSPAFASPAAHSARLPKLQNLCIWG